jgi:quinol monooxygenase YgiN
MGKEPQMIIVHDIFVCKPGNAGKFAKLCKETMPAFPSTTHVLTDMTGQFHRVIVVNQYEDLAAYQKSWEDMKSPTPEMQKAMESMKDMNEMYVSGSREIFKAW